MCQWCPTGVRRIAKGDKELWSTGTGGSSGVHRPVDRGLLRILCSVGATSDSNVQCWSRDICDRTELSPVPHWKGLWDKGGSQTSPIRFLTESPLPRPEYHTAERVRREKTSFYCGHQVREPGSHRGSSRSRKSAPAATRSDCTDQRTEAAAAAARFPCLWGTQRTGSCRQPSRQSCCRQWLRGGSGALSPRAMPSQSCACAERPRAPVPGSGAPSGPPGELPWGSSQTLRSTSPRRPSPASCTASEQRSELGKTGSRAQHTPGLLRLLAPPAFLSLHLLLSSFFSSLVGIPSHWPKSQGMIAP